MLCFSTVSQAGGASGTINVSMTLISPCYAGKNIENKDECSFIQESSLYTKKESFNTNFKSHEIKQIESETIKLVTITY